jgi:hypothetical protein
VWMGCELGGGGGRGGGGHAVAQLVETLWYKLEGRGFNSRFLPAELWPWVRLNL